MILFLSEQFLGESTDSGGQNMWRADFRNLRYWSSSAWWSRNFGHPSLFHDPGLFWGRFWTGEWPLLCHGNNFVFDHSTFIPYRQWGPLTLNEWADVGHYRPALRDYWSARIL